jgi:hypothetical protein
MTWPFPGLPVTLVGASGTVRGVAGVLAADALDAPAEFCATTVNVYAVPFVSPVTTHDVVAVVQVKPPGADVTV